MSIHTMVLVSSPKKWSMFTKNISKWEHGNHHKSIENSVTQLKNLLKRVQKPNQLTSHNLSKKEHWYERTKTNTKNYFHLLGLKYISQPLSFTFGHRSESILRFCWLKMQFKLTNTYPWWVIFPHNILVLYNNEILMRLLSFPWVGYGWENYGLFILFHQC